MRYNKNTIVICGTDTDVGKTIISALLVQGLKATYWKPIQCGLESEGDTATIERLINLPSSRKQKELYKLKFPASPHWAAELENINIDPTKLVIPSVKGPLVIETAGGLMVPITRKWLQIDQLQEWKLPIILVARSGLGTLNHTLLSLESLRQRGISILGIILNGPLHKDNPKTIEQIGDVEILAQVPKLAKLDGVSLKKEWQKQNLEAVFERILNSERE